MQARDDFRGAFFSREFPEILFDVLDFEGALLEVVLLYLVFHVAKPRLYTNLPALGTGTLPEKKPTRGMMGNG